MVFEFPTVFGLEFKGTGDCSDFNFLVLRVFPLLCRFMCFGIMIAFSFPFVCLFWGSMENF